MVEAISVHRRHRRRTLAALAALSMSGISRAQSPRTMVRIGFMSAIFAPQDPFYAPFFAELEKRGWREGVEYSLEARQYLGDPQRALAQAKELVARPVDILLASTGGAAGAAHAATTTIPIVAVLGYPVEAGLAQSLSRPGGNVTGVAAYASTEVWGKFIDLLREVRPGMRELGVLWDYSPPGFPDGHVPLPIIKQTAGRLAIGTRIWLSRSAQDVEAALATLDHAPVDSVIITAAGGLHAAMAERIASVFTRRRLPAITDVGGPQVFQKASCVLAYSPNIREVFERLAYLADRVLRGAAPATLPFELPSRFDLSVNARAAKAMGITVAQSLIAQADRVIE